MRNVGTKRKTEGNRKQARKLERQAKKSRKDDFFRKPKSVREEELKSKNQKKNVEEPEVESEEEINQNRNTIEAEIKFQNREKTKFKKKMSKKVNLEKKISKKELEAGIEDDDAIIKRLERKLGINKKKGKYEDEDILALGQDLENNDGINWGALEGKSDDEANEELDEGLEDIDEDEEMDYEDIGEVDGDEGVESDEEIVDGKAFFEAKEEGKEGKRKVHFAAEVETKYTPSVASSDTRESQSALSINSSDIDQEDWGSSDEDMGSDSEINEAIFGESSDEEYDEAQTDAQIAKRRKIEKLNEDLNEESEDDQDDSEDNEEDLEAEEGVYDSDEENDILNNLMNEGKDEDSEDRDEGPEEPDPSSEEAPENPGQVFGLKNEEEEVEEKSVKSDHPMTLEEKIAALPKSELPSDNVSGGASKYVPPAMRGQTNALERSVRGFLNRLSASNLYSISQEFIKIYRNNPRKEVSKFLTASIFGQVVMPTPTPSLLIEDYSCLLAILHHSVSEDISHFIIEEIILKYFELEKKLSTNQKIDSSNIDEVIPKDLQNLLSLVCCITRMRIFQTKLLFEILDRLADNFEILSVELIQSVLCQSGFILRKEDPSQLKNIISKIQKQAKLKGDELEQIGGSRVKFMIETLSNIKNNNIQEMKKNQKFVDQERDEGCKKRIRGVVGQVQIEPAPAIGLSDVLNMGELGRWWRVGAAVVVKRDDKNEKKEKSIGQQAIPDSLKEAAKKLRMNTDNKRNIFYLMNTAEDFMDATNKILSMNLKGQQRQDILFVMLEIVQRQKQFNQYYVFLLEKLIGTDRSFLMCTQCSYWDKFQLMTDLKIKGVKNLGSFLAHLLHRRLVPVTMLKKIDFSEINKKMASFLKEMILVLINLSTQREISDIFVKLHFSSELKMFREGFAMFVRHFVLKDANFMAEQTEKTKETLILIEHAIRKKDSSFML